uniref:Putative secreted protein n=1 Tax=Ixodes ricinus TaxID=34613 RepID=A0A6B0UQI9_IXORI
MSNSSPRSFSSLLLLSSMSFLTLVPYCRCSSTKVYLVDAVVARGDATGGGAPSLPAAKSSFQRSKGLKRAVRPEVSRTHRQLSDRLAGSWPPTSSGVVLPHLASRSASATSLSWRCSSATMSFM